MVVKSSSSSTRLNSPRCDNFLLPVSSRTLHPHVCTSAFCTHTASVPGSAHEPPVSHPWGRKHSAPAAAAALQTLELGESWSPCVHCPSSLTWQVGIPPSSYSWLSQHYVKGGMEEAHVSAPTIPNTICTNCITLWMQCVLLKLVKKMSGSFLSCCPLRTFTICISYLFFSPASKISLSGIDELEERNKDRKIKISEKKELHFSISCMHCLIYNICTYKSWISIWPFHCFFIYCSLSSTSHSLCYCIYLDSCSSACFFLPCWILTLQSDVCAKALTTSRTLTQFWVHECPCLQ